MGGFVFYVLKSNIFGFVDVSDTNERLKDIDKKCIYQKRICEKLTNLPSDNMPHYAIANTKRMKEIVKAEIVGLNEILLEVEQL